MDDIFTLLEQSKSNYSLSQKNRLDFEAINQASLDYFRMLLIKKGSYNSDEFLNWCVQNNLKDFFDLTRDDIAYLHKINILVSDDNVNYKFRNERATKTLLSYQAKSIEKNTRLIRLLGSVKDDKLYSLLSRDKAERFEKEVLSSKDGVERFLTHASKFTVNDFSNNSLTYLDCIDNNIDVSILKSQSEWLKIKIDGESVFLRHDAKPLVVLTPLILNEKIVGYSPLNLYDISQTSISKDNIKLVDSFSEAESLARIKDSVSSSELIFSILKESNINFTEPFANTVALIGEKIAEHYFIGDDERELFRFAFAKSLGVDISLSDFDLTGAKGKIKNVLGTLNLVNSELFLGDIHNKYILKEDFYLKLGKKDAENAAAAQIQDKLESLGSSDKINYKLGLDFSKINLKGSIQIAREILSNENIFLETNFEDLFTVTKRLTINSGDFKGESFVLEDNLSDSEFREAVAKEFLSKLVEKKLLVNGLDVKRIKNEFARNEKLLGREHTNDARRLHDEGRYERVSQDGERGYSSEISVQQSGDGDGYDKQPDRTGVQRERGLGDGEGGGVLAKENLSNSDISKRHNVFKSVVKKLAVDFPVLNAVGMYGILHGENEFLKVTRSEIVDLRRDDIKIVNFEVFGVNFESQKPEEFKNQILNSDLYAKYQREWFIGEEDKNRILFAAKEFGFDIRFDDSVYKKMFEVVRSEAVGEANSSMTLRADNIDEALLKMVNFRKKYPLAETAVSISEEQSTSKEIAGLSGSGYERLFEGATFSKFEHTQTHEMLNTMVLGERLDNAGFIEFSKFLTSQKLGYYSRTAKAFIVTDKAFLEKYSGFVDKNNGVKFAFADGVEQDLEYKEAIETIINSDLSENQIREPVKAVEFSENDIQALLEAQKIQKKATEEVFLGKSKDDLVIQIDVPELGLKKGDVVIHNGETANSFKFITPDGRSAYINVTLSATHDEVTQKYFGIDAKDFKNYKKAIESIVDADILVSNNEVALENLRNELEIETTKYQKTKAEIENVKDSYELTSLYYKIKREFVDGVFDEIELNKLQEPIIAKFNRFKQEKREESVAESLPAGVGGGDFNRIELLKLIWTESSHDVNLEFTSFEELQRYLEKFEDIPTDGSYIKNKFEILLSREGDEETLKLSPRIDISASRGDFNPFKQNIKDYLASLYNKPIAVEAGGYEQANFTDCFFKINSATNKDNYTEYKKPSEASPLKSDGAVFEDNFSIETDISEGGVKTKFKNYLAGIQVVRKVEKNEEITTDDKVALSRMPGVGTIAQAFPRSDGSVVKGWENEAIELKEALSEAEYKQAQRATLDAYYTDENIIKAIWKGVDNFGFKGGSVLEPSVGNGRFFGYMPKHLKPNSMLFGVELDKTTSKVAQILYPKAKIYNVGFENFKLLEGQKASLVIGNPPYGAHKISDKSIPDLDGKNIHNYFMGKGVDLLEEGGVMAMIVSSNFLDSSDVSTRAYVGKSANLVGAIRLPKGSFGNANTEIVTDIVFFQKRDIGMESNLDDWLNIGLINDTPINSYFEKNSDNLLGIWGKYGTMYRGDEPGLVAREGQDTQLLLDKAIEALPKYINYHNGKYFYAQKAIAESSVASSTPIMWRRGNLLAAEMAKKSGDVLVGNARVNAFFVKDNSIYKRLPNRNGESVFEEITTRVDSKGGEVALSDSDINRIKGMIKIAEVGTELRAKQLDVAVTDGELEALRSKLNIQYDAFVKEFGFLNKSVNSRLFEEDVNAPFLLALEKKYDKGVSAALAKKAGGVMIKESATKADIFFIRTQSPYQAPTSASSYEDALNICLGEKSFVDMKYISSLLGKTVEEIENYLSENDFIFDDPNEGWVTKEAYLSGNVKEKYKQTQNARNLEALEAVIPKDIAAVDINVACGSSWIPAKDVGDFVKEITQNTGEIKCLYTPLNASWNIGYLNIGSKSAEEFGTKRKDVRDVLLAALNNKTLTVYDTIGSGADAQKVVNQDETTAANDKVDLIKEKWSEWIWDSAERRERLGRIYNDKFNVYAKREYDGSHLTLPGKIDDGVIELRPHQKNAVWRALQNGRNLFDHTVGSGKTYSAIASVMELKRTEKARKPLVVVPKHLVGQWGREWFELYPAANILIPSEKDFTPARRKLLMSRIATGEYDAIIISHDHLGKIENDRDFEVKFIQNQIDEIKGAINDLRKEDSKSGMTVKQWEMTRQKLEYKMASLISKAKDDNISFLELGIDAMVVDEAHEFKNLQFHTSLQRIRGLGNPTGSQKAFDMYIKTQSLLERTGNKNLIFLTGTPISNTIAEMFTVKRYLMADELKADGLEHFDAWVKQYADIATDWELAANGKYKLVTRLSKFKNMPELMGSYGTFADIISIDTVKKQLAKEGKILDIPSVKGGKPKNIIVERSDDQAEFIGVADENGFYKKDSLVFRSENLPKGKPKKGDDNMLVIMGLARKASLDMRLVDEGYEDFKDSKVNKSIEDMLGIYKKWNDIKGTQLIFCDLSTPKSAVASEKAKIQKLLEAADKGDEAAIRELDKISPDDLDALNSNFSVYDDIKAKLIGFGIPEKEIAFIHDAKSKEQRDDLFAKVNSGSIRFLLGSTSKMGAGMNVQKRLVGLHHLDVPWRPSDLEQREGRIIRQGNLLFSFYKLLKDNNYSLGSLEKNEKFKSVSHELGLKGDALVRAVATAEEHGREYEVEINRYATKNTLDSGLWEKIEAKASFIAQIKNGDCKDREIEDISGEVANAAEMKAAASGNPLIIEEMKLKTEINKLEAIKKNFNRGLYDREAKIEYYKKQIDSFESRREAFIKDLSKIDVYKNELETDRLGLEKLKSDNKNKGIPNKDVRAFSGFLVELGGDVYDNREEAGAIIVNAGKNLLKGGDASVSIGSFAGFDLSVEKYSKYDSALAVLVLSAESGDYSVNFAPNEQSAGGLSIKLANRLDMVSFEYKELIQRNETILRELPELERMGNEFTREAELGLLKSRYKVVINELKSVDKKLSSGRVQGAIHEEREVDSEIVSERNNWVDKHKNLSTDELLAKNRAELGVLKKLSCALAGNCLVLDSQLEHTDYLKFEKIFKIFGGEWDRRLNAVVFSDDGLERIMDVLKIKSQLESIAVSLQTEKVEKEPTAVADKKISAFELNGSVIEIKVDDRVDALILSYIQDDLKEAERYGYDNAALKNLIEGYIERFKKQVDFIKSKDLKDDLEYSCEQLELIINNSNYRSRAIFEVISGLKLEKTQQGSKAVFETYFGNYLNEAAAAQKQELIQKETDTKNEKFEKEKMYFSHDVFDTNKIMSLSSLQRDSLKRSLETSYNYSKGGVMSLKEKLESSVDIEKEMTDNMHKWNRRKYKQMDDQEQREYDKKLSDGRSYYADGYEIPKNVFNVLNVKDITNVELLKRDGLLGSTNEAVSFEVDEMSADERKSVLVELAERSAVADRVVG